MKIHIIYDDTSGELLDVRYGKSTGPPPVTPGPGRKHITVDPMDPLPTAVTHRVDVGSNPHTLVAKTAQEQTDEANTTRKAELERLLGVLDATREKMNLRGFPIAAIDAEIAAVEAEHAALP